MKQFSIQGQHQTSGTMYLIARTVLLLFISIAFCLQDLSACYPDGHTEITMALPPSNDDCTSAISLTVNSNQSCASFASGDLSDATNSSQGTSCFYLNDIWYTFVATNTFHEVKLFNSINLGDNVVVSILEGTSCGMLSEVDCSNRNYEYTVNGLTAGTSYYVRVGNRWNQDLTSTFDICIGVPPSPPINDLCVNDLMLTVNPDLTCSAVTSGTLANSTSLIYEENCYQNSFDNFHGVWYSFVASSQSHAIEILNLNGEDKFSFEVYEGIDCGNLVRVTCYKDKYVIYDLTLGQKIYIHVVDDITTSTTFDICITTLPPPPPNDDCIHATMLIVNSNESCEFIASGTLAGATARSGAGDNAQFRGSPCYFGIDDDVWFKFVATNSHATVKIDILTGDISDLTYLITEDGNSCGSEMVLWCGQIYGLDEFKVPDLTVGNTYYIRIASFDEFTPFTTTFNVCVQSCVDSDMDNLFCEDLCPDRRDASLNFRDSGDAGGNTSDYVSVAHHSDFNLTDEDFAFEAWVYPTSGNYKTIVSKGHGGNANTQYIFEIMADDDALGPGKLGLFLSDENFTEWQYSNTNIPQDVWSHVAVSLDNSALDPVATFYLNGQVDGVKTYSSFLTDTYPLYNTDNNPFYIGRQGYGCQCNFFDGRMDELAVWNRTLTPADIAASMTAPYTGTESGLVAYYDFNDAAACGSSLANITLIDKANSHNGSLINFLTWIDSNDPCRSNWAPGHNRGACAAGCPPDLSLSGTQSFDLDHLSGSYISSNQHIDSPAQVNYDASTEISLLQSFEVKTGALFHAYISGCSN